MSGFFVLRTIQPLPMRRSFFASALTDGLIAGALDITAACIHQYLKNVLPGFVSEVFDPKNFSSPSLLAFYGLLVDFFIAISFTFFFFYLAIQIQSLVKYPLQIGILYGVSVWAAMRFIILQYLSRHIQKPNEGKQAIINASISVGILFLCIGIPVALFAGRYVKSNA